MKTTLPHLADDLHIIFMPYRSWSRQWKSCHLFVLYFEKEINYKDKSAREHRRQIPIRIWKILQKCPLKKFKNFVIKKITDMDGRRNPRISTFRTHGTSRSKDFPLKNTLKQTDTSESEPKFEKFENHPKFREVFRFSKTSAPLKSQLTWHRNQGCIPHRIVGKLEVETSLLPG